MVASTENLFACSAALYGLGNVLRGDDGFGPYAVGRMAREWAVPASLRIADLGTPGLDLVGHLLGVPHVVFVDTVLLDGAPGEVHVLSGDAVRNPDFRQRVTHHDAGLSEALWLAEAADAPLETVHLVGVIPSNLEQSIELSPAVVAAYPHVCACVRDLLQQLDCAVTDREATNASPEPITAPWRILTA